MFPPLNGVDGSAMRSAHTLCIGGLPEAGIEFLNNTYVIKDVKLGSVDSKRTSMLGPWLKYPHSCVNIPGDAAEELFSEDLSKHG